MKEKYRLIFIGTGEFAVLILNKLAESKFRPVSVFTEPDKPVGRKQIFTSPPVKFLAEKYKIPVFQPKKIRDSRSEIKKLDPDLIVVADYGQIISKEILDIPKFGALNIHPSLLPKYRGPSPIHHAILNGDDETGVTIILMDEKIDHGPIVKNSKFKIQNSKLTYNELLKDLAKLGSDLIAETLPRWLAGEIKPTPQDERQATYTKILTREDGRINWQKSAEEIERQIRAFEVWPQSWCEWLKDNQKLRLKILKTRILHPKIGCAENSTPGFVFLTEQKEMAINCNPGSLVIEELQMEGRNAMEDNEFLRGYPKIVGAILI